MSADEGGRREILVGAAAGLAPAAIAIAPLAARSQTAAESATATHRRFVAIAIAARDRAVAAGDQPYGAAIVRNGEVVVATPSRVVTSNDPTAHAEMEAIRDAARRLGTRDLGGAILYSSSPPCPMCEAAAFWAGIARLVYGDPPTDAGPPRLPRRTQ